ncbi:hypothetical protein SLA2020_500300 [Shorea laevis]
MTPTAALWILLIVMAMSHHSEVLGANVGVNYGRIANDLPPPKRVIEFLARDLQNKIPMVRLFDPEPEALAALSETNLVVSLGTLNEDLPQLAGSIDFAREWLNKYVTPYMDSTGKGTKFRYLTLGNEVIPGPLTENVLPAMKNLQQAVVEAKLSDYIQVSTVVNTGVLGSSYPPSTGVFADNVAGIMSDIVKYLHDNNAPLLINIYPYFAYISDTEHISLDYALFTSKEAVVIDGEWQYYNLFDAMVDAFVAAMVRVVGSEDIKVVVAESGWPSAGNEPYSSFENAMTYNNNLKNRIQNQGGTPRKPDLNLDTYIFALFNENQKPTGAEQHFGSFYPNLSKVYPLWQ